MAGTLTRPRDAPSDILPIQSLQPEDADKLRLPDRRSVRALRQTLERHPGRSVWSRSTLEYAIVGPWRHRPEIASVDELVSVRSTEALLRSAFERCVAQGNDLMLIIELDSQRSPTRFERAGLELLEEVITYEMSAPSTAWQPRSPTQLTNVDARDSGMLDRVTRLDQSAFPWLWRNNRTEFDIYVRTPGVNLAVIESAGEPIAYVGMTLFGGWGHIDRIAVAPDRQGRGIGLELLTLAVASMRRQGANRIALSTQRTNWRSQRLYERFGFRRTFDHDYRLFGRWSGPEPRASSAAAAELLLA